MSDNPPNEDGRSSARVTVRIPRKQYELMKKFGEVLGLETDGACVKHFVTLGLQASAGGISSIQAVKNTDDMLLEVKRLNNAAEQLDLVKETQKGSSN